MKKSLLFWLTFVFAALVALYLAVRLSMTIMGMGGTAPVRKISIRNAHGNAAEIADVL